jgi:adenine phosphoribosyltransferase
MSDKIRKEVASCFVDCIDFPVQGFVFPDITPLFEEKPVLTKKIVSFFIERIKSFNPTRVACIESFGYVLGAPIASTLELPLSLIRKSGKLPREKFSAEYDMIYCKSKKIDIHKSSFHINDRIVVVDDFLASGGTAEAAINIYRQNGINELMLCTAVDVSGAGGRQRIEGLGVEVVSAVTLFFDDICKQWKVVGCNVL